MRIIIFKMSVIIEQLALEGHNVFLSGAAGTGKTTFVKQIKKTMSENGKHVKIVCPTGIATELYDDNLAAQTIHSFFSLGIAEASDEDVMDHI